MTSERILLPLTNAFGNRRIALGLIAGFAFATQAAGCWQDAATRYDFPQTLLVAIATVESSGNPHALNVNHNSGTVDAGLMQINSQHMPELARHGISERELFEPCTSIHVGAWILARAIKHFGPTWEAVGAYNAGFRPDRQALRARYADRVRRVYQQLEAKR